MIEKPIETKYELPKHDDDDDTMNSEEVNKKEDNESTSKLLFNKMVYFSNKTTIHGLNVIFSKNTFLAIRMFWLALVLTGLFYSCFAIYRTISSYLEYPVVTKVETEYESRSPFPALTICSVNVFQRSRITDNEALALCKAYATDVFPTNQSLQVSDFNELNMTELTIRAGFNYSGFYRKCHYKDSECNPKFFKPVLTDYGRCVKFDPSQSHSAAFQTSSGEIGGLYIGMIFDHHDWTWGPYYTKAGFRVRIHEPGTTVYTLANEGIPILPGFNNVISFEKTLKYHLEPRHGKCGKEPLKYFMVYTRENCLLECQTMHIVHACGCKYLYMPGPADVCNLEQIANCLKLQSDPDNETIFDSLSCNCPQDCFATLYTPQVQLGTFASSYQEFLNEKYQVDLSRDGVGFSVFYKDLKYTEEIDEPLYSVEKLLGDIGGTAGLFLGCSFISIIELLQFVGEMIVLLVTRSRQKKSIEEKS